MPVKFTKAVANPDEPQGQVALRLREIVSNSSIRGGNELRRRANYAGSTLSEAMGGRKRQNRDVITRIVNACISDREAADAEIERLVAILEENPKTPTTTDVVELPPKRDVHDSETATATGRNGAEPDDLGGDSDGSGDSDLDPDDLSDNEPSTTPPPEPEPTTSEGQANTTTSGSGVAHPAGKEPSTSAGEPQAAESPAGEAPVEQPSRWGRTKQRIRRRPRLAALLAVLLLLIIALGGYAVVQATSGCGGGVALVQDECVGLSDGSVPLLAQESPQLTTVRKEISDENQQVLDSKQPYISLAYVFPWAAPSDPEINDQLPVPALQHELEGVLVAQREANHTSTFGTGPKVRVLLGNEGRATSQFQPVVDALAARIGGDPNGPGNSEHIVAVVASGKSVSNALKGIDEITSLGLPVLTTRMTSDEIQGNSGGRSVTRLAPNISDAVQGLTSFVQPPAFSAVLVQSSAGSDNYSRSLGDAFNKDFPGTIGNSYLYDPQATTQDMSTVVNNICSSTRSQSEVTVFFAGRSSQLNALIEALPGRMVGCSTVHFKIVTASDAIDTANAVIAGPDATSLSAGLRANADLYYTSVASPQAWSAPFATSGFGPPLLATDFPRAFPAADLTDGAAIIGADAVQTVASTVYFQPSPTTPTAPNTTPARVAQVLHERTGDYAIPLASGPLSIGPLGKAINKASPIIRVVPSQTTQPAGPVLPVGPYMVAETSSGH